MKRSLREERLGRVVSGEVDKTIVVAIETKIRHPLCGKTVNRAARFKAHDENNEARFGDRVLIVETKPLSRDKRRKLAEIIEKAE